MNSKQIDIRHKEVLASRTFRRIAETHNLSEKRVLDLGCGFGEYMQRFGTGSVGVTSTEVEVAYGADNGIDIRKGNVELLDQCLPPTEHFDVFWANNLFEHLRSPHAFLVNLKAFANDTTILILGVPLVPKIETLVRVPKFRGSLASPHINFFTKKTLELTVERAGWTVESIRPYITSNALLDTSISSLMPHLYLVAKNNASYRYPIKKVREWVGEPHYKDLLDSMGNEDVTPSNP